MSASPRQHRRWLKPTDIIILAIIAGLLFALLLPPVSGPAPLTEDDLDWEAWDPTSEEEMLAPAAVLAPDLDITGEWRYGWRHTALEIESNGSDTWRVTFCSGTGCSLGKHILLHRTARYEDAVLVLDRPVQELSGKMYQRIYSVRIAGREYLVPSVRVGSVRQFLAGKRGKKHVQDLEEEVMARLIREPAQHD